MFQYEWGSNTSTRLLSTDKKIVDMSYSPDRSKILALDEDCNILELDIATRGTKELLSYEVLKELVLNELAATKSLSSEDLDAYELTISHVYCYEDDILFDDNGSLYSIKPQNSTWTIEQLEGVPHFSEFFLMNVSNSEKALLKISDYDHDERDFDSQKVEFYVYDMKSASCKKLLETGELTGYPFGDNYMVCIDSDRSKFAYIDYSCSDYADIRIYDMEENSYLRSMEHMDELGTKGITERCLIFLLDSEEALVGVTNSGFSRKQIVVPGVLITGNDSVDIEVVHCAI